MIKISKKIQAVIDAFDDMQAKYKTYKNIAIVMRAPLPPLKRHLMKKKLARGYIAYFEADQLLKKLYGALTKKEVAQLIEIRKDKL